MYPCCLPAPFIAAAEVYTYIVEHGPKVSTMEVAKALNYGYSTAISAVKELKKLGVVEVKTGRYGGVRLIGSSDATCLDLLRSMYGEPLEGGVALQTKLDKAVQDLFQQTLLREFDS